jgi:hypothetical protein
LVEYLHCKHVSTSTLSRGHHRRKKNTPTCPVPFYASTSKHTRTLQSDHIFHKHLP